MSEASIGTCSAVGFALNGFRHMVIRGSVHETAVHVPASLRLSTTGFDPLRFLPGSFSSRSSSLMFSRVFVALTFTSSHRSSMARTRFLRCREDTIA